MKTGLVFLSFIVVTAAVAQDKPSVQAERLTSITWDAMSGKLVWTVQKGVASGEEFVPSSEEQRYEISPENAVMAFEGQERGFTDKEAAWLQGLLRVLSVYCAESTVWWDRGQGVPLEHGKPVVAPPSEKTAPVAPTDVESPETAPHRVNAPAPKRVPGLVHLVAMEMVH